MAPAFDIVVIGSGIGGLSVASVLAQLRGSRVLVLEKHFKIGGFTHVFQRPGGFRWDVGLHYVGDMASRSTPRILMDFITRGKVRWNPMPDPYDKFIFPGFSFSVPVGENNYKQSLAAKFP